MATEKKDSPQPKRQLTQSELHVAISKFPGRDMLGGLDSSELFVGQKGPRKRLFDAITQSPAGTVIIISEPLGAGKSTLISVVRKDLERRGFASLDESKRTSNLHLDVGMSFDKFSETEKITVPQKVIFIEEFDRKVPFLMQQEKMKIAAGFIGNSIPIMVLSGDYSLRNPSLVGVINSNNEPTYIRLDPVTPEMLKSAFELRLRYVLGKQVGKIDMDALFDREFMRYLIPNTNPSIATIRTSLVLLQNMVDNSKLLKLDHEANKLAKFSGDLYEESSLREPYFYDAKTWHFVSWLHSYIGEHDPNVPMEALKVSDFINLYGVGEISEKEFPKILGYLARRNILKSVGIPYVQD